MTVHDYVSDADAMCVASAEVHVRSVECLLLDNSGHCWILARDGLSANDPKRTLAGAGRRSLDGAYGTWRRDRRVNPP